MTTMIEIERVLSELRRSGMAATLQTRLLQAQTNEQELPAAGGSQTIDGR